MEGYSPLINRSTPLDKALDRIEIADRENSSTLDLSGLGLDFEDLKLVIPKIARMSSLDHLNLSDNLISKLPEAFGELKNLKFLALNNNQLTDLPRGLIRDDLRLDLSENPQLDPELQYQVAELGYDNIVDKDPSHREILLWKMYGLEAIDLVLDHLEELGIFQKGMFRNEMVKDVVLNFLDLVPTNRGISDTIYIPALASLLWPILDPETTAEERKECLQEMKDCLPFTNFAKVDFYDVNRLLINERITQFCQDTIPEPDQSIPEVIDTAIRTEALAAAIQEKIPNINADDLEILIQLVYAPYTHEVTPFAPDTNTLEIKGPRPRLDFDIYPELLQYQFRNISEPHKAVLFHLLGNEQQYNRYQYFGEFDLDPQKINEINESYFASLGLTSKREKAILDFAQKANDLLENEDLQSFGETKDRPRLDINQLQSELRAALLTVFDDQIEEVLHQFLNRPDVKQWEQLVAPAADTKTELQAFLSPTVQSPKTASKTPHLQAKQPPQRARKRQVTPK